MFRTTAAPLGSLGLEVPSVRDQTIERADMKDAPKVDEKRGIYEKYAVKRTDGRSEAGEKHYGCRYFVLDLKHDIFAAAALREYARACGKRYPELAVDLFALADDISEFPVMDAEHQ